MLVIYSGDPHNEVECPSCQSYPYPSEEYSREKEVKKLDEGINELEKRVEALRAMKNVVQNPNHPIVKANLTDDAMND